jgi:hypothetical protein
MVVSVSKFDSKRNIPEPKWLGEIRAQLLLFAARRKTQAMPKHRRGFSTQQQATRVSHKVPNQFDSGINGTSIFEMRLRHFCPFQFLGFF